MQQAPVFIAAGAQIAWLATILLIAGALLAAMPVAAQPASAEAPPAPADAPRFDIWEYAVEGNTVLPALRIETAVLPHLGPSRTMADVEAARAALEAVYQGAGYLTVFVDVPEQKVDEGVVRLAVLEGRVGRLRVTGSEYHSPGLIRKQVSELAEGTVPDFNRMQEQLGAVARTDEIAVQPVLKPGRAPGTLDAELQVQDKLPLSGSIEINNDHPRDTDPWRVSGNVRWTNLFQRGQTLSLTGVTAPADPSQSRVFIANWSAPLAGGATLSAFWLNSDSSVESLGGTTALGDGNTFGLRWAVPFGVTASSYHTLTAGFDYKNLHERLEFGEDAISTPVRYLPMQIAWQAQLGSGPERHQLDAAFVWSFRQILNRDVPCPAADGRTVPTDQFQCKRSGADGSFAIFRGDWRWQRPIGDFGLSTRVSVQAASKPLISAEQFALGGSQSVRGYLDSEATGDHGVLVSIEGATPNLVPYTPLDDGRLMAIAFVDAGRTYLIDPLPGEASRTPLLGIGAGLRYSSTDGVDAAIDVARAGKPTPTSSPGRYRLHVRFGVRL